MMKIVLIADEEANIRLLIQMMLQDLDIEFHHANDKREAMNILENKKPDLLIIEQRMLSLGDYEILKQMQENEKTKNIPVIILINEILAQLIEKENVRIVSKSFSQTEIKNMVKMFLGLKETSKKILIADDDSAIRQLFSLSLSEWNILEARDGNELIELAKKEKPDLIISDVMMPGMDGFRAVDRLKKISGFALTPVIFVSGAIKDKKRYEALKPEGPS